jgi:hypothetical protein
MQMWKLRLEILSATCKVIHLASAKVKIPTQIFQTAKHLLCCWQVRFYFRNHAVGRKRTVAAVKG